MQDLANGIGLLVKDPDIGEILGERARQSLEGVFDWETIANGVVEVYIQLIKNRKKLSRHSLSKYLKSSYMPVLEDPKKVSDFVVDGQLVYPVFSKAG